MPTLRRILHVSRVFRSPSHLPLHRPSPTRSPTHHPRRSVPPPTTIAPAFPQLHPSPTMSDKPIDDDNTGWEKMWQRGINPGDYFDARTALPELQRQLDAKLLPLGGRVLIPGCGRGYDVEAFCRTGAYDTVVGMDISETAVEAAREYLRGTEVGGYELVAGDFFVGGVEGTFRVVYDYTFFCAIPLEWRSRWGARMKELVEVGGVLVTVMFPYDDQADETGTGPPFRVNMRQYRDVLEGDGGFVVKEEPKVLEGSGAHEGREGKTWWCAWQRV